MKYFFLTAYAVLFTFIRTAADPTDLIIDGKKCGPNGDAKPNSKEFHQNVFKNRFEFPKSTDFVSSITLEKMAKAKENEAGFSQSKAVEIEGFIFEVKPGGLETCNCHASKQLFKDTHIEVVSDPSETGHEKRVIVEITPRLRQMMEEQGIDWTTPTIRSTFKNKFVRIQGWLFFDISHNKEDFANDPDDNIGKKNWRATSWEVHPVTSIEIAESDNPDAESITFTDDNMESDEETSPEAPTTKKTTKNTTSETTNNETIMGTNTPQNVLVLIALGAILGMVGQGIRVIVGIKKMNNTASELKMATDDLFKMRQLVMSLFIAFAVGAIAGVLAAVTNLELKTIDKSVIIAFITAGYAGTDFIEGFMKKEGNVVISKNKVNG